jgi:hypothetical protein
MSKYLAAWTPPISPYPPFISITSEGAEITIVMRSGVTTKEEQRDQVACKITKDEFLKLIYEAVESLEVDEGCNTITSPVYYRNQALFQIVPLVSCFRLLAGNQDLANEARDAWAEAADMLERATVEVEELYND